MSLLHSHPASSLASLWTLRVILCLVIVTILALCLFTVIAGGSAVFAHHAFQYTHALASVSLGIGGPGGPPLP